MIHSYCVHYAASKLVFVLQHKIVIIVVVFKTTANNEAEEDDVLNFFLN